MGSFQLNIRIVLFAVCIFILGCADEPGSIKDPKAGTVAKRDVHSKVDQIDFSCDIASIALALEKKAGYEVDLKTQQLVAEITAAVAAKIDNNANFDSLAIVKYFDLIHREVQSHIKLVTTYHSLLSTCLKYGIVDCDVLSLVYISVSQNLGLPVYGMLTPGHMFVIWRDKQQTIYWETTLGQASTLAHYKNKYLIADSCIGIGMNLRPLGKRELISVVYFNIAKEKADMEKDHERSTLYNQKSAQLAPDWQNPVLSQALNAQHLGELADAEQLATQMLNLYPCNPQSYISYAGILEELGCWEEAVRALSTAINILQKTGQIHDVLGLIEQKNQLANGLN